MTLTTLSEREVFVTFLSLALLLVGVIGLGLLMTFAVSKFLSATLLKGTPSSFTLELPPYRKPQVGRVIVRSIFDRTLFVLGRAAAVAAPAGLLLWAARRGVGTAVPLCLLLVLLWSAWHRRLCLRDFGGITGDLTGFFISTAELLTLAVSALGGLIL